MQRCLFLKEIMSNILITSAGKRVSLIRAFQKELECLIPDAIVYAADSNQTLSAACQVVDKAFTLPKVSHVQYMDVLIDVCIANNIKVIIPTIDTELELLAANQLRLIENNIYPVISSIELVKQCRDKRKIHNFFEFFGIYTAKEYSKKNYSLPLFIKPIDGSRSVDTYLIQTEKDLTEYHFQNKKLMFLEYIDHELYDEYTCDMYYGKDNELKCVVPRKRIEVRDGEVNKGKTSKNHLFDFLKEKMRIVDGARGCLTAQFFLNKKTNHIVGIEINPRFGGGYPLSYLAGANFPSWIIQEYLLNEPIVYSESWEDNLLMLRYDHEILVKDSDA